MKLYFKTERLPSGSFTEWAIIAALPEEWPKEATVGLYPNSGNKIYNVPGDQVRYYEMLDGAICHNCGALIDKSCDIHAETCVDREKNLCKKCWSAIDRGELDLPQRIGDLPLYRVKNSPYCNP